MIELYENITKCSGCSACVNICPTGAIHMKEKKDGFVYPEIDVALCIECGKCLNVCPFKQTNKLHIPIKAYAAINKSSNIYNSASGGAFLALATEIINRKGIVFGVAWNEDMVAEHVAVNDLVGLKKLQGSKYVQSSQKKIFSEVKKVLENGKEVLYSGTPCQIAGLKNFLGQVYEKLYTIDLICHGVPSEKMHTDYVRFLEEKYQGKVVHMNYREKSNGWSLRLRVDYKKKNHSKSKRFEYNESYYYDYFINGLIYRESCYQCPFARSERVSDITLGDYWGVEKYHPQINTFHGVSSVLINTKKGIDLMKNNKSLILYDSKVEWIADGNGQLKEPCKCDTKKRKEIVDLWKQGGAKALSETYNISFKQKIRNKIVMCTPYRIKDQIKKKVRTKRDKNI